MERNPNTRTIVSTAARTFGGILLAFAILVGGALMVRPAVAQEMWVERNELVTKLGKTFAEAPTALGLTSDGAVIELFRTPDGETWTLVITLPNGYSRVIGAGQAWTNVPVPVKGRIS